jgi:hypothetical protein
VLPLLSGPCGHVVGKLALKLGSAGHVISELPLMVREVAQWRHRRIIRDTRG